MAGKAGGGIARPGSDKMLSVLSDALMQCSAHAAAYGACAQKMLPEVYGHTSITCGLPPIRVAPCSALNLLFALITY